MTVKERLIKFIKYKNISNSEFCRKIGVSSAFISSMVSSMQPDKVERIALNYPELNTGWLLTGEGEMLKSEHKEDKKEAQTDTITMPREVFEQITILSQTILSQQRTIESLEGKKIANSADDAQIANAG